ncbi:carbohydrate kinase family protein [Catellatospora methionotrophica]|uniref:carbohydrate kinase family protein n=1 Tax=Catellatospora methionotrophica TaxID=121620 RepID=UPI00340E38BC
MPALNYGVEITSTGTFLAGDGPIVAGALAALGRDPILLTNAVGDDPQGRRITERLRTWGVTAPASAAGSQTMVNTVICDDAGNRTWFSGLRGIGATLDGLDLTVLDQVETAYIDCYEVLGDTPRRVFDAAQARGIGVYINLGGGPLPPWMNTSATTRARVVQTNAPRNDHDTARRLALELAQADVADIAVVTAGELGAYAAQRPGDTVIHAPAIEVAVRQVQGAGSVFSAALLDGLLSSRPLNEAIRRACTAGSLWCARTEDDPFPTGTDLSSTPTARAS